MFRGEEAQDTIPQVDRLEWPTLVLTALIYGLWLALTLFWRDLPLIALIAAGGWIIAWHGSLQHEIIHGHPTPWRRLNTMLGWPPLSLWLPYTVYRSVHLGHHAAEHLTDPAFDPEARYLRRGQGSGYRAARILASLQSTLAGRLLFGPVIDLGAFALSQAGQIRRNAPGARLDWALHLVGAALVVAWLHLVCGMPVWLYGLTFVYPGAALSLVRSFAEHRAARDPAHRVAVVERSPVLGLLFLFNNLHAVHHTWPGLSWWRIPGRYRRSRDALLAANGGLVYRGYGEVFARFLWRPHDAVDLPADVARLAEASA